jgi:bacterioferritin-associated ferredoxin
MADIFKAGLEKVESTAEDAYRKGDLDCLAECIGVVEQCPDCFSEVCELIPDDDGGQPML